MSSSRRLSGSRKSCVQTSVLPFPVCSHSEADQSVEDCSQTLSLSSVGSRRPKPLTTMTVRRIAIRSCEWQLTELLASAVIKRPMDLATVLKKVKSGAYKTKAQFKEDVDLIWANCFLYNTWPVRKNTPDFFLAGH